MRARSRPRSTASRQIRDSTSACCRLPFGVRDGTSSLGNFNPLTQYQQTVHGKRLIGGYLSGSRANRSSRCCRYPVLDAVMTLSAQGAPAPLTETQRRRAYASRDRFLINTRMAYVVTDDRADVAGTARLRRGSVPARESDVGRRLHVVRAPRRQGGGRAGVHVGPAPLARWRRRAGRAPLRAANPERPITPMMFGKICSAFIRSPHAQTTSTRPMAPNGISRQ